MGKPKDKKKKLLKVKKKRWVEILAPKIFKEVSLGKTYLPEKEAAIGREMKVNLMNITKDPKKQAIIVSFKIDKLNGERLGTTLVKYNMQPSAVRRFVRRSKERVDDSFIIKSVDNIRFRVKPILITRNSTSNSVKTALRAKARQDIANEVAKITFDNFIGGVLNRSFQKRILDGLKKICPLSICEIRAIVVSPDKRRKVEQEEAPKPAEATA